MKTRSTTALKFIGIGLGLCFAMAVGYLVAAGSVTPGADRPPSASYGEGSKEIAASLTAPATGAPGSVGYGADGASPTPDMTARSDSSHPLVIMNGSMAIRVNDVDLAVTAVRTIANKSDSQISSLVVHAGEPAPSPLSLTDGSASPSSGPATADITLRVPADVLSAVQEQCAKLGVVLTQSAAEDDVTQEHVDLTARLRNLRAEEARLRGFLDDARKVSEMLEVERELSRVRGEIESMQAQVTYLERQAAMATLSLSLSEPGPVASPGPGGWGLTEAITNGIRAAAALVRGAITAVIAVLPIVALVGAAWLIWRRVRRRRHGVSDVVERSDS